MRAKLDDMAPVMRAIVGFQRDAAGVWVADLACGHRQHVRHAPPWQSREWVLSEQGRAAHVGVELPCPSCEMPALPDGVAVYRQTEDFDQHTLPAGLRRQHALKAGTWGRIVVLAGRLLYVIEREPLAAFVLTPELPGIVPPEIPHHVEPRGPVRLRIEFYR
jgi:tellurite methyltransferase